MDRGLGGRLETLERQHRRTVIALGTLCVLVIASGLFLLLRPAAAMTVPDTLRVSELVVVDREGTERVRLSGDMPDAVIEGRRIDRGSKAAGVMLYDRTGQERGGYVTWDKGDNVGLTLDGRKGQNALFVAGPDGSTSLQIWHGQQALDLRADANGARLSQSNNGQMQLQLPQIATLSSATCGLFRNGLRPEVPQGLPMAQVRDICSSRFSTAACDACLAETGTR
ncbi:hypothetical protein [Luteimonas terrae]|uniref:Uncharacterized protein n=1 Tax=Luteimonas terrae TaxID=1530191 RepID=A0ABU1Y3A4_9GAMM|nr:hypothetical protein [Luteimonas terrae]MDR7194816.1 hypothetical protein [Luteimonas terrae]